MNHVSKEEITDIVNGLNTTGRQWHYHLMTPTCRFNDTDQFALFVEDVENDKAYVLLSERAQMKISKVFAKLLHGKDVVENTLSNSATELTRQEKNIIEQIDELTSLGMHWHHHVFFPHCIFSNHKDNFELVLENPSNQSTIISVSRYEPKQVLRYIEKAFYSQKSVK